MTGLFSCETAPTVMRVGDPHTIRFREDALDLFPELADQMPVVRPNGKIAIEMFTRELPIDTAPGCSIDHVVFLESPATRLCPSCAIIRKIKLRKTGKSTPRLVRIKFAPHNGVATSAYCKLAFGN